MTRQETIMKSFLISLMGVIITIILVVLINNNTTQKEIKLGTAIKTNAQQLSTQTMDGTVFAYYYDWYSAPPFTTNYGHWDGGALNGLPDNIESAFYPSLGAYSSNNPSVVSQHMSWIKQAKVDVIILSWWGQNDYTDQNASLILNEAARQGVKVCFMIEPYNNRTIQSMEGDVKYIIDKYGNYPAFYKVVRPSKYGPSTLPRPVFFLYSLNGGTDTTQMIDSLRGTSYDSIFLGRMDDSLMLTDQDVRTQLSYSHVDGFFNYGPLPSTPLNLPRSNDYILIFSALPGWDHTRILPYSQYANDFQLRNNGSYYDGSWQRLLGQHVEAVAVISFNEWHEGGQIEPSTTHQYSSYIYNNYDGAYNITGQNASLSYIMRTAFWSDIFKSNLAITSSIPDMIALPTLSDTYSTSIDVKGLKDTLINSVSLNNIPVTNFPDLMHWQTSTSLSMGINNLTLTAVKNNGVPSTSINIGINRHKQGDINGDGKVDIQDLSIFSKDWRRGKDYDTALLNPLSDQDEDGSVDLTDLSIFAKNWQ